MSAGKVKSGAAVQGTARVAAWDDSPEADAALLKKLWQLQLRALVAKLESGATSAADLQATRQFLSSSLKFA